MLPQRHRLRTGADFAAVIRGRRRARAGSGLLVVHATVTDPQAVRPPRVGFVVSAAVGGAVVRNRVKRRLRALMAARLVEIPGGVDVVVRAQPGVAGMASADLGAELDRLLDRALSRAGHSPARERRM